MYEKRVLVKKFFNSLLEKKEIERSKTVVEQPKLFTFPCVFQRQGNTMDIDIVNAVLRLCIEQQTCLFEVSFLYNYCAERELCKNPKHILASIRNYTEIFKISLDQDRIELFLTVSFEIR